MSGYTWWPISPFGSGGRSPSPSKRASTTVMLSGPPRSLASAISLRSEEHTSELQSHSELVCRLRLEKKSTHGGALPTTDSYSSTGAVAGTDATGDTTTYQFTDAATSAGVTDPSAHVYSISFNCPEHP